MHLEHWFCFINRILSVRQGFSSSTMPRWGILLEYDFFLSSTQINPSYKQNTLDNGITQ
jgi:hypothetical protein